jgi:hypothetical protein
MMHRKVGCSSCVFEVLRKLSDELETPSYPRVAEVQVMYGLGLNALRAGISSVSAESPGAAPPASDTIADDKEYSEDEE